MKSLTVSELTQSIKNLIENEFSGAISVSGEISGYSVSPSGHAYFVLKDEKAKIKAVMFRNSIRNLGKYSPNNGDKVVAVGNIKLYEPEGNYQIVVKQIIYDTVGDFYKQFEETKRKLEQEGLFAKEKKKQIKPFVKRIALITSPNGAAIKDFLITLKNNNISIEIDIYPSQVQGNAAIPFIIKNIMDANGLKSKYDLLILMRGGGSLEDLSIFNDEFIARALFDSKIPTVSAIGHERDFSIVDFVADVRVATPTAAAEFISNLNLNFINQIEEFLYLIENITGNKLNDYFQNLDFIMMKIQSKSPGKKLNLLEEKIIRNIDRMKNQMIKILIEKKRLTDMELYKIDSQSPLVKFNFYKKNISYSIDKIKFLIRKKISDKLMQIENSEKIILNSLTIEKISYNKMLVNSLTNEIKHKISDLLLSNKSKLELMRSKINLINPENILDKGYAVVTKNSKLITDISNVKLDDELEIKLRNGYINSFVTGKRKK